MLITEYSFGLACNKFWLVRQDTESGKLVTYELFSKYSIVIVVSKCTYIVFVESLLLNIVQFTVSIVISFH